MATTTSLEVKQALNTAAKKLLEALEDVSELTVETYIFPIGAPETDKADYKGKIVARTKFRIDGDTSAGLPAPINEKGEVIGGVDERLLELHNQNLERALKYRSDLLKSAQDLAKDLMEMLKNA